MVVFNLFITSFVVGFSGASAPGPMMTMVITQCSLKGWKDSIKIVFGHAMLEAVLIILLLLGLQPFLQDPTFLKIFTFLGSIFLSYMGISLFISLIKKSSLELKNSDPIKIPLPLAGALVSLSNPYWLIWWVTVGVTFLGQARSFFMLGILSFYVGHIFSDFVWYIFIGFVGQGLALPLWNKLYKIILYLASFSLIFFSVYFLKYVILG
uniref:Lysine transporter LysE n=1 Tax=Dictyoglomus thermophilum TaxID=14 RepID=A0A7C3MHB5_DICTH